MSDSYSAGKYAEAAAKERAVPDCNGNKPHQWQPQTPFYGAAQCSVCKKVVYTK